MTYNPTGLIMCARYSFAPNSFHYCGPEKQSDLLGYVSLSQADQGLAQILGKFETLYQYLLLIAAENYIRDPFDPRVVEAYWLGNKLLEKVRLRSFARHLEEGLSLKKNLTRVQLEKTYQKLELGFPQHTFHVLNIFRRTGHHAIAHTLSTMDACRISWGQVKQIIKTKHQGKIQIEILSPRLLYQKDKLVLGKPETIIVTSLLPDILSGNWVSVHWGIVCDRLTQMQMRQVKYYTQRAIDLANSQVIN